MDDLRVEVDKQLAQDVLDALDTGCANGGFGPAVHEVECDESWIQQKEKVESAIRAWIKRHNLFLVKVVK